MRIGNNLNRLLPPNIHLPLAVPRRLATNKHRLPPLAPILSQRKEHHNRRHVPPNGRRRRRLVTDGLGESVERECAESGQGQ